MTVEDFPVIPLVFETNTGDDEAEWWRIVRDCYERLGWGFAKSGREATKQAEAMAVKMSKSSATISTRAKSERWEKASVSARTADEKAMQLAPANEERKARWLETRAKLADDMADLAVAAAGELRTYFSQEDAQRKFQKSYEEKSNGSISISWDDGSARAQRHATIMGIVIDKADQLVQPVADAEAAEAGVDTRSREEKAEALAPLLRTVADAITKGA